MSKENQMTERRLWEETPCEHEEVQSHGVGLDHRLAGVIDCPGGVRREIVVDYEAGAKAFVGTYRDNDTGEFIQADWRADLEDVTQAIDAALGVPGG